MNNTHMLFINNNGLGGIVSLCCRKINGVWKLHIKIGDNWQKLQTGLSDSVTECSPTICLGRDLSRKVVSFVSVDENANYFLNVIENGETKKVKSAQVGFVNDEMTVYGSWRDGIFIERDGQPKVKVVFPEAFTVYRVSYDPQNKNRLFISGEDKNLNIFSWIFDISKKKLFNLTVDQGLGAYKFAKWNDDYFYSKKIGNEFEDREVVKAELFSTEELPSDFFKLEEFKPSSPIDLLPGFLQ